MFLSRSPSLLVLASLVIMAPVAMMEAPKQTLDAYVWTRFIKTGQDALPPPQQLEEKDPTPPPEREFCNDCDDQSDCAPGGAMRIEDQCLDWTPTDKVDVQGTSAVGINGPETLEWSAMTSRAPSSTPKTGKK